MRIRLTFDAMAIPDPDSAIKGQTIPLIAIDTIPKGIVLIKEETDIKLIMDKLLYPCEGCI